MRWWLGLMVAGLVSAGACSSTDCEPACSEATACVGGRCRVICARDSDCSDETICVRGYCETGNRLYSIHCLPPPDLSSWMCRTGGPVPDNVTGRVIEDEADLTAASFEQHTVVIGDLVITAPYLSDVGGLGCIVEVDGNLVIQLNACLESLSGLEGVATVSGDLRIEENDVLVDLGLDSLQSVGGQLIIVDNDSLSQTSAESFAAGITAGSKIIEGNGGT